MPPCLSISKVRMGDFHLKPRALPSILSAAIDVSELPSNDSQQKVSSLESRDATCMSSPTLPRTATLAQPVRDKIKSTKTSKSFHPSRRTSFRTASSYAHRALTV